MCEIWETAHPAAMTEVEDFIQSAPNRQREIMVFLHRYLTEDCGLTDKIRFKIPFYYGRSWICYLNPLKEEHVELAFLRGNELSNAQGLLLDKGRQQVMGIDFGDPSEAARPEVREVIQEAIILDETIAYESKRKAGKKRNQ